MAGMEYVLRIIVGILDIDREIIFKMITAGFHIPSFPQTRT